MLKNLVGELHYKDDRFYKEVERSTLSCEELDLSIIFYSYRMKCFLKKSLSILLISEKASVKLFIVVEKYKSSALYSLRFH